MQPASKLRPAATTWLWKGHIPSAAVTMIDGDPGLGKSQIGVDLAARISRGDKMPDGSASGVINRRVVIYNPEDPHDLQISRLKAAGADLSNIFLLPAEGSRKAIKLPRDQQALEMAVEAINPALVILDPIGAVITRSVLQREDIDLIREIAKNTGAAFMVVRHLIKGKARNELMGGGGAAGAIGAARAAFLVTRDPNDPENRRVFAPTKNNAVKRPKSWLFHLDEKKVRLGNRRPLVSFVSWDAPSDLRAIEVMAATARTTIQSDAKAFLEDELAHGPRMAKDLLELAKSGPMLATTSLFRARDELKVESTKIGPKRGIHPAFWVWTLSNQKDLVHDDLAMAKLYRRYRRDHTLRVSKQEHDGENFLDGILVG